MPYFEGMGAVHTEAGCPGNTVTVKATDKLKRVELETGGCSLLKESMTSATYCCSGKLKEQKEPVIVNTVPPVVQDVLVPAAAQAKIQHMLGRRCHLVGQQNGLLLLRCDANAASYLQQEFAQAVAQLQQPSPPPPTNGGGLTFTEETFPVAEDPLVDRLLNWVQGHPVHTIGAAAVVAGGGYWLLRPRRPRTRN
jgi:hypothetical protein